MFGLSFCSDGKTFVRKFIHPKIVLMNLDYPNYSLWLYLTTRNFRDTLISRI